MQRWYAVLLSVALAAGMSACAETSSRPDGATSGSGGKSSEPAARAKPAGGGKAPSDYRVYFDFDSSDLKRDGRVVLGKWADYLAANPDVSVTLEGHCDERGTAEYNIGLGERRANAARELLVGKGVSAKQIRVVSYGEEKPLDAGHDESAWRKNRRVEVQVR